MYVQHKAVQKSETHAAKDRQKNDHETCNM